MAKLPPQPVGVAPGSSYWNDWYEKLRRFVDQVTTSVDWSIITGKPTTLAGYGITDAQTKINNSADLAAAVSDETGTGVVVFNNNPALINPVLGTPASATLTNATGLPVSTGISGLGAGVATFLATPSSANLAAAVTDETGTGALVFNNSPAFVTPALGVASATSLRAAGGNQIASGTTGASLGTAGAFPQFAYVYSVAAADNKIWDFYADATRTHFRVINDAQSAAADWMTVTRSGITVSGIAFGGPVTVASAQLLTTSVALTNAAGAAVGTLNNSPVAGNPTKWIEINDNGTIRRIPTW